MTTDEKCLPIDPQVRIGHVHLKVADLERSLRFYCGVLGFELTQRYGMQAAFISAGGYHHHIGLNTWESLGGSAPQPGTTGLYHTAILYPTRKSLADALQRLKVAGIALDGASDHGVSEALYLRDPDENGVELYWDRPKDEWPRTPQGEISMFTRQLDLNSLLKEIDPVNAGRHLSSETRQLQPLQQLRSDSGSGNVQNLPMVYLARHGETAWTISGQHTGLTDLPLTERGERNARRLGDRLKGLTFTHVFTSPLRRTWRTCELAGFGSAAVVDHDLVEWNYGLYDGKTTEQILKQQPGWELFRDGCPNGESVANVTFRARRVIERLHAFNGNVLLFSSGHFLRVLAACWLELEPTAGQRLFLSTAALSILGYNHGWHDPVMHLWNDCTHDGK